MAGQVITTPKHHRGFVPRFVEEVQARGRLTFTLSEIKARRIDEGRALEAALRRHAASGAIRRVSRKGGFFIIVPPEFRAMGAPPLDWWLDDYMAHLRLPYYLGLLSAAEWHGSAHFAVMGSQVMVSRRLKPVEVGRTRIRFFLKARAEATPKVRRDNLWGSVAISTPEATLLDLLRYSPGGGIDRITLVAADLAKSCRVPALKAALDAADDTASAQRLGFLLEQLGRKNLTGTIATWLSNRPLRTVDLEAGGAAPWDKSPRWHIRINAKTEVAA